MINKFLYPKGGDAICTLDTGALLQRHGHEVIYWGLQHPQNPPYPHEAHFMPYVDMNQPSSTMEKSKIAGNVLYSLEAKRRIEKVVRNEQPDIAHLHNIAHQISPSILDVFKKYGIPVIMTMHDYKLVCASYLLYDGQQPCQACGHGKHYNCFLKRCVKNSRAKSLLNMVEMYLHHKILHIYDTIDIFISPSMFLKGMLQKMGFKEKTVVIPNFIDTEKYNSEYSHNGYMLYFGRLSGEKGLHTLLRAARGLNVEVHIVGSGPYEKELVDTAKRMRLSNVRFCGYLSGEPLHQEIANALCVVLPSEWYENNPRSVLEAFACGKPVIGADIGGIPELVKNRERGLLFTPGDRDQLRDHIEYCMRHPDDMIRMGTNARQYVLEKHDPEDYYNNLMRVYTALIKA